MSKKVRSSRVLVVVSSLLVLALVGGCSSSPEPAADSQPVAQAPEDHSDQGEASPPEEAADEDPTPEPAIDPALEEMAQRVSDEDLAVFARGVRAVSAREAQLEASGEDLESRYAQAASPLDRVVAEQEIFKEMEEAVQAEGIAFEAFLTMGQIIRHHPGLLARLGDHLEEEEIQDFFFGE